MAETVRGPVGGNLGREPHLAVLGVADEVAGGVEIGEPCELEGRLVAFPPGSSAGPLARPIIDRRILDILHLGLGAGLDERRLAHRHVDETIGPGRLGGARNRP